MVKKMKIKSFTLCAITSFLMGISALSYAYYIPPDSILCKPGPYSNITCTNVDSYWVQEKGSYSDVSKDGEWFYFVSAHSQFVGYPKLFWDVDFKYANAKNSSSVSLSSIGEDIEPENTPYSDWRGDTCTNRIGCRIIKKSN